MHVPEDLAAAEEEAYHQRLICSPYMVILQNAVANIENIIEAI